MYTAPVRYSDSEPRISASEPVYDDNGVDRTLIRQLLDLSPEERLRQVQQLVEEIQQVWQLNGTRPLC